MSILGSYRHFYVLPLIFLELKLMWHHISITYRLLYIRGQFAKEFIFRYSTFLPNFIKIGWIHLGAVPCKNPLKFIHIQITLAVVLGNVIFLKTPIVTVFTYKFVSRC